MYKLEQHDDSESLWNSPITSHQLDYRKFNSNDKNDKLEWNFNNERSSSWPLDLENDKLSSKIKSQFTIRYLTTLKTLEKA